MPDLPRDESRFAANPRRSEIYISRGVDRCAGACIGLAVVGAAILIGGGRAPLLNILASMIP